MELLTDLEASALGCTYRHQPCTAHFVRTLFRGSASARFSDSAGSVYPMMRRLERRGLLSSERVARPRRRVRLYAVTAAGRRALRGWIGPPLTPSAAITVDPLRTRVLFLELLAPARRAAWLDEAERLMRDRLEAIETRRTPGAPDDPFLRLADANARLELETRLEWVRRARRTLRKAGLL